MNIVFLCGSLEPGKDGVGDYTRRIAGEILLKGNAVSIIALHDSFVVEEQAGLQGDGSALIPVLRLPTSISIERRILLAANYIKEQQPQWISLQYVLYAFHRKGLPLRWVNTLKQVAPKCKWHIMMHELWIGSKKMDSLKKKAIGVIQKTIIQRTFQSIKPLSITTNVGYYQKVLSKMGYPASILPVYSNLPEGTLKDTKLYNLLPEAIRKHRDEYYIAVLFGGIQLSSVAEANIKVLPKIAAQENRKLVFVHVGRSGSILSLFDKINDKNICSNVILGEQPAIQIASFFHHADFGVSTYSKEFLGKSGSIAAMLYNGLPVILLTEAAKEFDTADSKAEYIGNIPSLEKFSKQPTWWCSEYGVANAAAFYTHLFT